MHELLIRLNLGKFGKLFININYYCNFCLGNKLPHFLALKHSCFYEMLVRGDGGDFPIAVSAKIKTDIPIIDPPISGIC